MIFVTVGTQLPFDRLIRGIDEWAGRAGRDDVFAQIGPSEYSPRHISFAAFVTPEEHRERMAGANAIVAHAGMGTIINGLELGKPVLVMPRRAEFGEHRNDHQLATAERFEQLRRVAVAWDERDLPARLNELDMITACRRIQSCASDELITAIRGFIATGAAAGTHLRPNGAASSSLARRLLRRLPLIGRPDHPATGRTAVRRDPALPISSRTT